MMLAQAASRNQRPLAALQILRRDVGVGTKFMLEDSRTRAGRFVHAA